jgi:hypothetical protein
MDCQSKSYQVIGIISIILLIISLGFIIAQSIINIIYTFKLSKKIIVERLIYEQFSHEVYSNINSHPFTKITEVNNTDYSCSDELIRIPIKFEEFYDCGNDENIDEFCQNKITPESLCCQKSCCFEKIENKKESKYCLQKRELIGDDIRKNNEPRDNNNNCIKFSKYHGKFYKLCVKKSDKTYEDYLNEAEENNYYCSYSNPKIDSKGHCIYSGSLIFNSDKYPSNLIVKNIFSTTPPNYFEMESKLRISMMLNRKEYNENEIKNEIKKISEISSKNIYDTFNDIKCTGEGCSNQNYIYYRTYNLKRDIFNKSDEYIFKNYKNDDYYSDKPIYWYSRNYIGFQNFTELKKFKNFFDVNDHKNNCLFKISKPLFPNIESIIIGIIVIVPSIVLIIHLIKNNKVNDDYKLDYLILLVVFILFLFYFLMYLIEYLIIFKEIDIDMEDFYSNILKKYNYRRRQLYLMIAVIILIVDVFLELLKLNIKISVNNPERNSGIFFIKVKIKINESNCQAEHNIRLYYTKAFSYYTRKINMIFSKCRNCRDFDINSYKINGNEIDENKTIQDLNIQDGNKIICEE